LQLLLNAGVVAVIRTATSGHPLQIAKAILAGGVHCVEIAMTIPNALKPIEDVVNKIDDVLIGAGTVLDTETARVAILAGA